MCPYSTSRVQLRTEGLTQPPMGPGRHRPSTHQPHEAPHIHRSEATRRSRASRDANRSDLSGTTTLPHVTRSRRCQAPVSRSTSRRSCHTASDRQHQNHAEGSEKHRFHHIASYRWGVTPNQENSTPSDQVESSQSGGIFPMGWLSSAARARQRHDGRRERTPQPAPVGGAPAQAP